MPGNWSAVENEAIVSDYFAMLLKELRSEPYNKASHRRALARLLNHRSDGSIERKHQNISAILNDLGRPAVFGYKPLGNYQTLLRDVIERRLPQEKELMAAVQALVAAPAEPAAQIDILDRIERPPDFATHLRNDRVRERPADRPARFVNYLEQESRNMSLGRAGEEFVVCYERARLRQVGRDSLAERVEHVAVTEGDGQGFDVRSYEHDGSDRLIEVKTTTFGKYTPFFLSRNEVSVSRHRDNYHLYRVFRFREDPRMYKVKGALDQTCLMEAIQYQARPR